MSENELKNNEKTEKNGMERGLQNRHVQIIAIAGTIGTGLFLGAGRSISLTGPSIILIYMLTGLFMYLMMRAIGLGKCFTTTLTSIPLSTLLPNIWELAGGIFLVGPTGFL